MHAFRNIVNICSSVQLSAVDEDGDDNRNSEVSHVLTYDKHRGALASQFDNYTSLKK